MAEFPWPQNTLHLKPLSLLAQSWNNYLNFLLWGPLGFENIIHGL